MNEIAGIEGDSFTDEIRSEADTLHREFKDLETRHRSAIMAEGVEEQRAAGQFTGEGDGEPAEIRSLLGRVNLADYLTPASAGLGLAGPAAELNAALECPLVGTGGGVAIPWRILAGPELRSERPEGMERRAFTDTGDYAGGVAARPILQRLFGMDIMAALGVRMDSVPAGRTEWPLITGGVAPTQKAEGTAADAAVAATFATETLKAKKLTGKYEWTHEQAAQVPDLEQALRRDLADAVKAKMSDLILLGNEGTNAHEPDGFLTKIAAPADPGATSTFADYAGTPALAVDGIHASWNTTEPEREVREDQPFTDAIVGAILAEAAGAATTNPHAIGALEAAANLYARCFAAARVTGPDVITPACMALVGRNLVRRGDDIHLWMSGAVSFSYSRWDRGTCAAVGTRRSGGTDATCSGRPGTSPSWCLPMACCTSVTHTIRPGPGMG